MYDYFIGLDPSFNSFGVVVLDKQGGIVDQKIISSNTKFDIEFRLVSIEEQLQFLLTFPNSCCYIEGPSYYSSGKFALQMGALHYLVRVFCLKNSILYKIISPSTLKKFVTGVGNCKKEMILLKVYQKWGVEFSDNNLADAFGLAKMAFEE